jgi:hypothetical protein
MHILTRAAITAMLLIATATATANTVTADIVTGAPSDPPGAIFSFKAEPGAHPVSGRGGEWIAPNSEIRVWEYQNIVKIDAENGPDYIRIELNGPDRRPLAVGTYQEVRNQIHGPASSPGILVISDGLGCGNDYAEFVIYRIDRDIHEQLVALEATFTQHCESPTGPALNGHIHFQA